jgi:hypothetical protein
MLEKRAEQVAPDGTDTVLHVKVDAHGRRSMPPANGQEEAAEPTNPHWGLLQKKNDAGEPSS